MRVSVELMRNDPMMTTAGCLQVLHYRRPWLFRTSLQQTTTWKEQYTIRHRTSAVCLPGIRETTSSHARRGVIIWFAVAAAFLLTTKSALLPKPSDAFLGLKGSADHLAGNLHVVHANADVNVTSDGGMQPEALCEDVVQNETLFACGKDRWLCPTLVARPCMHRARTQEDSLSAVHKCMETVHQTLDRLPGGENRVLVLYDLGGAGYKNFDMVFTRELIQGLVDTFPDRLGKVLVFNGHWSLRAAWSTVSRLLHPETRQRVIFCDSNSLLDYVERDHPYVQHLLG